MSIENPDFKPDHLKRRRLRQAVGSAVALAAMGAAGVAVHESNKEDMWKQDRAATIEIAKRFTDCRVESFTDTQTPPDEHADPHMQSPKGRTTLKLRISLNEKESAQSDKAPYQDNDRVLWSNPMVYGAISPRPDDLRLPELGDIPLPEYNPPSFLASNEFAQRLRKEGTYPGTLNAEFYPKTTYPDGKQARIIITEAVSATDDSGQRFAVTGFTDCGVAVFDGSSRTWKLVKDSGTTETAVKQYEDTDRDGTWNPTPVK